MKLAKDSLGKNVEIKGPGLITTDLEIKWACASTYLCIQTQLRENNDVTIVTS